MPWVKLELGDDWGHRFWKVEDDAPTHSMDEQKVDVPSSVRVRWPDGHETEERLVEKSYHDTVSDMGHSYPVSGSYPVIEATLAGVKVEVPLDKVEVWLE